MELPERRDLDVDDFKSRWQLSPEQLATTKRTEDELEENVRTFVLSEIENLDWTYEKADVNVSKTMIRS